ncbi:UAP56-interacting factor-like isoform X2 [Eleutherodactylus coqui]|uniref:UAP56-interacting factor-like isoform X2 n=1 Tax=Eleutherodactylus coqui TaxID=57060 RepID=UPI00346217A3
MEVDDSQSEAEIQEENKKIDMSLDDIIRLQKEESDTQSTVNQTRQNGRIKRGNFQNRRYFRNAPRNQQGSGRPKPGFRQQRYPGVTVRNNALGPITRRRAAASRSNVSPLNRLNLSTTSSNMMVQTRTQKVQRNTNRYKAANRPAQSLPRRINTQNRRPQMGNGQRPQRANTVNRNRLTQQVTMNRGKRQTNARWQINDGFGSTLTVSVPNPKASFVPQSKKAVIKRPGGRFRKTGARPTDPPPKGVPLRFNFRAMANHTNVTLNERFSSLKIKGQYIPGRGRGRTVLLA